MYPGDHGNNEEKLDALFQAYRNACPDREPGVNFMPGVWQKIETRQRNAFSFLRMAQAFATAAAAATLALGVYLYLPHNARARGVAYQQNYLEALADANSLDTPDIVGPVRLELTEDAKQPGR
ncbi:MAG: hypothetical protein ACLQVN_06325 [Bryobacteraceae bacterium]